MPTCALYCSMCCADICYKRRVDYDFSGTGMHRISFFQLCDIWLLQRCALGSGIARHAEIQEWLLYRLNTSSNNISSWLISRSQSRGWSIYRRISKKRGARSVEFVWWRALHFMRDVSIMGSKCFVSCANGAPRGIREHNRDCFINGNSRHHSRGN